MYFIQDIILDLEKMDKVDWSSIPLEAVVQYRRQRSN